MFDNNGKNYRNLLEVDNSVSLADIERTKLEIKQSIMMEQEVVKSLSQLKRDNREKIFTSKLYEQFDDDVFKIKMGIDVLFYESLISNELEDKHKELVSDMIKPLFKSIYEIYKHIDIKPEFYGKLTDEIITAPMNEREKVIHETITDHLNRNYYKLPISKRLEIYESEAIPVVTELIENNKCPIDKASEIGTKTVVIERFLTKVAFPKFLWETVKSLQEDEDYEIFDQDKLVELVNNFKSNVRGISKIISCKL